MQDTFNQRNIFVVIFVWVLEYTSKDYLTKAG